MADSVAEQWLIGIGLTMLESKRDMRSYGFRDGDNDYRILVEYTPEKFHLYAADRFIKDDPSREDVLRLCESLGFELKVPVPH